MQLYGRLVVLALCVLGAHAVPSVFTLSPSQAACSKPFTDQAVEIEWEVQDRALDCFAAADQTTTTNPPDVDDLIKELYTVQYNVDECLSQRNSVDFLDCTVMMYETTSNILNELNVKARQLQWEYQETLNQNANIVATCVNQATSDANNNLTRAAIDYSNCVKQNPEQRINNKIDNKINNKISNKIDHIISNKIMNKISPTN